MLCRRAAPRPGLDILQTRSSQAPLNEVSDVRFQNLKTSNLKPRFPTRGTFLLPCILHPMFHPAPGLCVATVALVGSLMTGSAVVAQQGASGPIVRGTVYDTISGDPIAFAVVSVAGSDASTLTSRAGAFRLAVPRCVQELQFRKIGYRMRSV